jgi:3-hydroxyacyl-CoA dehydrogenase/enoyl-CoA hydratase/carnithine racemase
MPTITLTTPQPDIAVLTLDMPDKGANVLSRSVLEDLAGHLDQLEKRRDLAGLVIRSGKPGMFVAGADLREFAAALAGNVKPEWTVEMCRRGQNLFRRLSQCPFVTVAAIDGVCLGGGAELAIWCDRRIMSANPKAQFGFPEVKLGLFPGWGGTARAPRIIGLSPAVELVAGGESIDGKTARGLGLVSDVAASDRLDAAAIALVREEQKTGQYKKDRERWSGPLGLTDTELYFLGATSNAYIQQETKGHYPAPLAALEVMLEAAQQDIDAACRLEAEGMAKLFGSPVNRALLNVFFLSDRNKKDTGVDRADVQPRTIKSLGVFGAGIMGSAIAAVAVKRKLPVAITDVNAAALAKGVQGLLEEVSYNKTLKGADVQKTLEYAPLVNSTTSDAELAGCDLVIEAVVENVDVKKKLYARVEPLLRQDAILASNTSTIPIGTLSAELKRPERFCGIHFFNPVRKMPLVEVIRGPKTSDETVATAVAFAKAIGKSPIVVNDGPGFLVNRCLLPYMNEALELLLDGASIDAVERAAKAFGMPMGPLTLYDVVGIDTAFYAGSVLYQAFPDRCLANPLIVQMVKANRLGQKTGSGFFKYKDPKGRGEADPEFDKLLQSLVRQRAKFSDEQITHRLFLPMLLEATRILEDKIVRDVRDVDLGLIYGIGFPPFKGGLFFWADTVGAKQILEWLKPLEPLGERMKPTKTLREMAASGRKFYVS